MASLLEEKDAIRELLALYCHTIDAGEYDRWVELFTEDGVFDLGNFGRFQGRESLRSFANHIPTEDGKPTLRHCVLNSMIDVEGDRARARSYVVVFQGKPALAVSVVGRYEDELRKVGGSWRFAVRKVSLEFLAQG
ncbi:MAG: hypothetical protein KatS3mg076_1591 [Candidatus Binatia bacterium]|nr:MAG: hypothetical protein KatS3mg076_1591 [Candidatus Binatia bacterium]